MKILMFSNKKAFKHHTKIMKKSLNYYRSNEKKS